jgi:hypothetical protein
MEISEFWVAEKITALELNKKSISSNNSASDIIGKLVFIFQYLSYDVIMKTKH